MRKLGEKQKRKPKIKHKRQSERVKKSARKVGADESVERILEQMGQRGIERIRAEFKALGRELSRRKNSIKLRV
jgi:hypothetical protein